VRSSVLPRGARSPGLCEEHSAGDSGDSLCDAPPPYDAVWPLCRKPSQVSGRYYKKQRLIILANRFLHDNNHHWHRLVKILEGQTQILEGNVVKTDKCMITSQILGVHTRFLLFYSLNAFIQFYFLFFNASYFLVAKNFNCTKLLEKHGFKVMTPRLTLMKSHNFQMLSCMLNYKQ